MSLLLCNPLPPEAAEALLLLFPPHVRLRALLRLELSVLALRSSPPRGLAVDEDPPNDLEMS